MMTGSRRALTVLASVLALAGCRATAGGDGDGDSDVVAIDALPVVVASDGAEAHVLDLTECAVVGAGGVGTVFEVECDSSTDSEPTPPLSTVSLCD